MRLQDFISTLQSCINEGKNKPDDEVVFRHSIHEYTGIYSSVDYILTAQKDRSIVLCYDDGMF